MIGSFLPLFCVIIPTNTEGNVTSPESGAAPPEQEPHLGDQRLDLLGYTDHADSTLTYNGVGMSLRDFMASYSQPYFLAAMAGLEHLRETNDPEFAAMQQMLQTMVEHYLNTPTES